MRSIVVALAMLLVVADARVLTQAPIPQPTNPVVFCFEQAAPDPDTWQVIVNDGAPQDMTPDATKDARCPAGSTHSFRLAASLFPIGNHTLKLVGINQFGSTTGPAYAVTVGIAPGQATITAVFTQ